MYIYCTNCALLRMQRLSLPPRIYRAWEIPDSSFCLTWLFQLVVAGKHGAFHVVLVVVGGREAFRVLNAQADANLAEFRLNELGSTLVRPSESLTRLPAHLGHQSTAHIGTTFPSTDGTS